MTFKPEQERLIFRLREAELSLNRFLEVKSNKAPKELGGYCEHLKTPEELEKAGITNWGIMGGDFLVPIDTDKQEMADIIRKVLPRTFEVLSVGRKLPHFYFLVWGKNNTAPPNGTLHIPGDLDEKGRAIGAGEIRVNNQYIVAAGTDVDYYNKDGEHIQGRYKIINDVPIAKMEYDDFTNALKPYRTENEKIILDEMQQGIASGKRHAKAMSYAYHLIANLRLGYDLALTELNRFGKLCDPPLLDQEYFDRALKAAINAEAKATYRKELNETKEERAKKLWAGHELRVIDEIKTQVENKGIKYPKYNDLFPFNTEKKKPAEFKPAKVALWLYEHDHFKADKETDILYFGDIKTGRWTAKGARELKSIVTKILENEDRESHYRNILHSLVSLSYTKIEFSNKIACVNGLLDLEAQQLTPFNLDEMAFQEIPIIYEPEAKCPNWESFVKQIVADDDIPTLQEWSGFLLLPDYRFHKMMWMVGTGRNGKGVWQRIMEAILGKDNISGVGLEEFDGNHRFAMKQLYGKLFNPCSEPSTKKALQTNLLKKATGQDTISAEMKGKQDRLDFRSYAKITVLANKFPKVYDQTIAFKERRLFLKFPNEFLGTNQIQNVEDNWLKINDERSGILNWMLQGLERLLEQGHFTESKTQRETEIEFLRASDTLSAFIKDMFILDKNTITTRSEVTDAYLNYCDVLGLDPEEKFLQQKIKETQKIKPHLIRKPKQERAWKGFKLKNITDEGEILELSAKNDTGDTLDTAFYPPTIVEKNNVKNKEYVLPVSSVSPTLRETLNSNFKCGFDCGTFGLSKCPNFTKKLPRDQPMPLNCNGWSAPQPTQEDY